MILCSPPFEISKATLEKYFCTPDSPTLAQVEAFWQEMKTCLFILDPNHPEDIATYEALPSPEFIEPLEHGFEVSLHILSDWGEGVYVVFSPPK
jgi:hypothetical protein